MRIALLTVLAIGILWAVEGKAQPAASPAPKEIAWGGVKDGLKVGLSCEKSETDSEKWPALHFYLANEGPTELENVIQTGECCVIVVNGQYYAQSSTGGKSSFMPPGRKYGPLPIDLGEHRLIPDLDSWSRVDSHASPPELKKGDNTISIYYRRGSQLVQSGEIKIMRP